MSKGIYVKFIGDISVLGSPEYKNYVFSVIFICRLLYVQCSTAKTPSMWTYFGYNSEVYFYFFENSKFGCML